ncbi:unannotated protein [freshwater metagenome]|uniref:Unannotated protein n=1 Tax=freshwater metagenome TaxID=449393 RepID=A0A6J7GF22_9ZZZZ
MTMPPMSSARANCHPIKIQRTIPMSMTKFVLANIKTIEAVKFAPLLKRLLANALAAYEHDELTIPKKVAFASVAAESSPRDSRIRFLDTKAWTTPESANPRTSAQKVSKNIHQPPDIPERIFCTLTPRARRASVVITNLVRWRGKRVGLHSV